jgi:hypothetical protein
MRSRLLISALAFALAWLAGDRSSLALPEPAPSARPYDAPRVEPKGASIPPLPPEYLTQEEGWLKIAFHPSVPRERIRQLISQAGTIRADLASALEADVLTSLEVRIAAVPGEMARLSPAEPPGYTPAVAWSELGLVVMSLASPVSLEPPRPADVLRHELAHIALDQAVLNRPLPRWFHEGYAVAFAGDHGPLRTQTLCLAALRGRLLGLSDLEANLPADAPQSSVAYAEAADFIRYLGRAEAKDKFSTLIRGVREGDTLERAMLKAYEASPAEIEMAWRKDMARRYGFLPVLLCGALVWIAAAAGLAIRRARRDKTRRPIVIRHAKRIEAEARSRSIPIPPSAARSLAVSRAPRELVEGAGGGAAASSATHGDSIPPDADVPKVEHEGEWHTLH